MQLEQYEVILVTPERLHPSPHQPKDRTASSASMNALKASIVNVGLQYPPLVVPKPDGAFQVIDGHRRIEAMKLLAWQQIPVLPTQGRPEELFAEVSGHVVKMKSTQWVQIFLSGGTVPAGPNRTCIKKLHDAMGREYLEELAQKGWSPQIWNVANRVVRYLSMEDEEDRRAVLRWLLNVGTREVSAWITGGNSADRLKTAFKTNERPTA